VADVARAKLKEQRRLNAAMRLLWFGLAAELLLGLKGRACAGLRRSNETTKIQAGM